MCRSGFTRPCAESGCANVSTCRYEPYCKDHQRRYDEDDEDFQRPASPVGGEQQ